MQQAMGWDNLSPYEYYFERGLYLHEVWPNLICGSQPRNTEDIDELAEEHGITYILNLQQDRDLEHWGVDIGALQWRAQQHGMVLARRPARDFDPHSLRAMMPGAVATLHKALQAGNRVYVHCTAGLGRAPAICIANLYWMHNMTLDEAYHHVTSIRPCGPKREAVRGATYDLASGRDWDTFNHLPSDAFVGLSMEERDLLQHRIDTWHV
jgi:hypothetical protein